VDGEMAQQPAANAHQDTDNGRAKEELKQKKQNKKDNKKQHRQLERQSYQSSSVYSDITLDDAYNEAYEYIEPDAPQHCALPHTPSRLRY